LVNRNLLITFADMDRLKNASDEERERIQAEYKQKVEDIVAKMKETPTESEKQD